MKNTQKILIAILVLVFIGVVVLVAVVKSDKFENTTELHDTTLYTIEEENSNEQSENKENSSQLPTNADNQNNNAPQTKPTVSDKQNNSVSSDKDNINYIQSSKTYDLSDSEVLQSQRSSFGDIKLITAKDKGKKIYLLEASVESKKFYYEFPGYYNIENIYYANIDGYYGDEIIIRSYTGINNIYDNVVLKITPNGIQSLLTRQQSTEFMASYSSTLKKDFNVEITNSHTGLKKTVNVKEINDENYTDSYWESDGSIAETELKDHVWFEESYYIFEPRNVDDDNMYEIVCSQNVSLGSFDSLIGSTLTTLKFNAEMNKFEIVKTEFYPKSK